MKLGYLVDRVDSRDWNYSSDKMLGAELSRSRSLRLEHTVARDQSATNACTGFAVAQALAIAYFHQNHVRHEFSAFDLYYKGRKVWGGESRDAGSYLRTVFRATQMQGAALESAFPSTNAEHVNKEPTWPAIHSAHRFRGLRGYYRIGGTSDPVVDVRRALSQGLPVVGGWQVDQAFWDYAGGLYEPGGKSLGGHAMLIEGFDDDYFDVLNSWGTSWGEDGGRARVDEHFVRAAHTLWAVDVRD